MIKFSTPKVKKFYLNEIVPFYEEYGILFDNSELNYTYVNQALVDELSNISISKKYIDWMIENVKGSNLCNVCIHETGHVFIEFLKYGIPMERTTTGEDIFENLLLYAKSVN